VNELDEYGESPLHYACCAGQPECVKVCLKLRPTFVITKTLSQLLLRSGANVNAANENGITPLHHAARLGQ